MSKYYGKEISPIIKEIADSLWEIDAREIVEPYEYEDYAFAGALKILMSVSMDRLWAKQEKDNSSMEDRTLQATKLGTDIRNLFKDNLDIDTTKLYEDIK